MSDEPDDQEDYSEEEENGPYWDGDYPLCDDEDWEDEGDIGDW